MSQTAKRKKSEDPRLWFLKKHSLFIEEMKHSRSITEIRGQRLEKR